MFVYSPSVILTDQQIKWKNKMKQRIGGVAQRFFVTPILYPLARYTLFRYARSRSECYGALVRLRLPAVTVVTRYPLPVALYFNRCDKSAELIQCELLKADIEKSHQTLSLNTDSECEIIIILKSMFFKYFNK